MPTFDLIADYVPDASGRYRIFRFGDVHLTVWGDGAIFDDNETDRLAHLLVRVERFDSFDTDRASGYLTPSYAAWEAVDPETLLLRDVLWIGSEAYVLGEALPEEWRPELPAGSVIDGDGQTVSVVTEPEGMPGERFSLVIAREAEDTRTVANLRPADLLALLFATLDERGERDLRAALSFHFENADDVSDDFAYLVEQVFA